MTNEPKTHQREDGKWVILDQPDTVFWWAMFEDEKTALHAWKLYGRGAQA